MLSIILAIILFFITLPLKAVELSYRVGKDAVNKLTDDSKSENTKSKLSDSLRSRLSNVGISSKSDGKLAKSTGKALSIAKKSAKITARLLINAVKTLVLVLRLMAMILAMFGVLAIVLVILALLIVVAILGWYLSGDIEFGGDVTKTKTEISSGSLQHANGKIGDALKIMANAFIGEVAWYPPKGTTAAGVVYDVSVINGGVRPDCTGFAQAVFRCVIDETGVSDPGGSRIPSSGSSNLCDVNASAWVKSLPSLGFVYYESNQLTLEDLELGDCLVCNGHAEFYVDESHTFGWGSVKTEYPQSRTFSYDASKGVFRLSGDDRDYTMIYRYVGDGSSDDSTGSESSEVDEDLTE